MKKSIFFLLFSLSLFAQDMPNIIWITVDTLRKDYVGKWSSKNLSPNIDSLLKDSVVLDNCFTPTPITFPSYTSALTGMHPLRHGVFFNTGYSVPENLKTIAEILKENGYYTISVIGGNPLHYGKGLERGFDIYDDEFLKRPKTGNPLFNIKIIEQAIGEMSQRPAEDITEMGLNYIKNAKNPYFLFLHYYDPHTPYNPPKEFSKKHLDNLYAGEVEYTDNSIGRFLKELKKLNEYDKNIIVFFSDHGEGLGEHSENEHGFFLYNTTISIAASIKLPFSKIKKDINEITTIMDITPTILDLIGIKFKGDGISLKNAIFEKQKIKNRDLIIQTKMGNLYFGFEEINGILSYPFKAVFSSQPEVFNLSKDIKEEKNLYPENFREMKKIYVDLLKNISEKEKKEFKTEDNKKLKSLGYLTPAKNLPKKDIPPSKWKEIIDIYRDGNTYHFSGKYLEAIKIYSDYLKKDPMNFRILM
ncbi:MAG: sulfatase, partial [Thermoanaerobaculia bacterium]